MGMTLLMVTPAFFVNSIRSLLKYAANNAKDTLNVLYF
ncbi:hypothetical protein RV07_GL002169 [Enterococcus malodoratus]|nr:hypothetical protein RV07_GL002169 [Enterococcus malodoratus]